MFVDDMYLPQITHLTYCAHLVLIFHPGTHLNLVLTLPTLYSTKVVPCTQIFCSAKFPGRTTPVSIYKWRIPLQLLQPSHNLQAQRRRPYSQWHSKNGSYSSYSL